MNGAHPFIRVHPYYNDATSRINDRDLDRGVYAASPLQKQAARTCRASRHFTLKRPESRAPAAPAQAALGPSVWILG